MLRCKVCGCEFDTTVENHYISRDSCQIVTQERKREYIPAAKIDDEGEDG